jgi:ABC-type glycerol-3-phosphate transport system substrate-binding protein
LYKICAKLPKQNSKGDNIMSQTHSRRAFLKMAAVGVSGAALAACAMPVPAAPGAAPGAQEKVVRILLPSWATGEIPFDTTAREFNEAHPGTKIEIQTAGEGWDTKVMAQIQEGKLEWSGAGIASSASSSLPRWILSGMVQPMDDLIAASTVEGAAEMLSDMIPTLRNASTHEGKFWGIPYSFENISFNWRTDYFGEVGVSEAPKTFDEWLDVARALKEWGGDQQIFATSFIPDLDASVGTLIYGSLEQPFDDNMILKWESQEAIDALTFYKTMVDEGLTPPHGFDGWLDAYYAGKLASVQPACLWHRQGHHLAGADQGFGTQRRHPLLGQLRECFEQGPLRPRGTRLLCLYHGATEQDLPGHCDQDGQDSRLRIGLYGDHRGRPPVPHL